MERRECGYDDRSFAERSAQGSRARACAQPVKWKYTFGAKAKIGRPKAERTDEQRQRHRDYMRAYMREQRARMAAEERTVP
jgi:hypothetical protein